nr:retrovirus-related Pol polyprotein from transposon TNT 1-94 [Tanacetum cinerariifolium]
MITLFSGFHELNQIREKENVQCYNCNAKGHYARDCLKPKVRDARYFTEQILLVMTDEAGGNLNEEQNDFMLDNAYGDDTFEELSVAVIMMAHIQPTDDKSDAEPKYDSEVISEVNSLQINLISGMLSKGVHKHTNHEKLQIVINTSADDQIDLNIIFDRPYVKDNGGKDKHDSNSHDQSYDDIESMIYNVQKEAKNQQKMNNELKKQKALLQKEFETCKERVKILEKKPVQSLNYKSTYEALEHEISVEKDTTEKLLREKYKIQGVASSRSARRPESKDTNLKKRVLLNTKSKSTSTNVKKFSSGVSLVSNKRDTLNSTVCQSNASVLKAKTANAVNDGLNLVCVSCGKDVFMISHEKCVARYALPANSRVKRALFTFHVAAKSRNLRGLGHNLFSVGQFFDGDLEVAVHYNTCYVLNLEDEDLLTSSRDSNLYTISISEMAASSPVYLMSKATSTKPWLWHRRLSHLSFGTINHLTKQDLVNRLLKFKYDAQPPSNDRDDLGKMKPKADIEEPVANEPTTPVSNDNVDEIVQEYVVELDENTFYNPFHTPVLEDAESSSTFQDPSNMHEFHQQHHSTDLWTKNHPIEQVVGDLSKPVVTRRKLYTDAEMCMFALTLSNLKTSRNLCSITTT